jgi:hypothetical protein
MNVYQRPLFRQMGGPVAPGMAAQEAMPDPAMAQQLQSAEQSTAANMQRVGQGYVSQTMGALDAAETPKDLIDAIRGNQMPLEARFQELAQFVGEADAQRTPESVLALVQPTIMMTEQGAMDSGIGELMQGLTGEIEMETAEGAPTAMGQGVGSLMMAGANAAPGWGLGSSPSQILDRAASFSGFRPVARRRAYSNSIRRCCRPTKAFLATAASNAA